MPQVHPLVDEVLTETYGVMVYQEQVMRIFNRVGNIPLRRAYDIIKAISKKNAEVINKEKTAFIEGRRRTESARNSPPNCSPLSKSSRATVSTNHTQRATRSSPIKPRG